MDQRSRARSSRTQSRVSAGKRAVALTDQLLTFARQQELSPVLVDMNEVIDGLSSILHQLLPTRIRLDLALSEEPVIVFVDPSRLEQVVVNLVVNSRDAIGGPGTVTVTTATRGPSALSHDLMDGYR